MRMDTFLLFQVHGFWKGRENKFYRFYMMKKEVMIFKKINVSSYFCKLLLSAERKDVSIFE